MGKICVFTLPAFTPLSLLALLSNGCIDSTHTLRRQLKRGGFKNELSIAPNPITEYCMNEFDFARILTFETNDLHCITNEWFNIVLASPLGQLYYVSFSRECGESYIPGGILRNGGKTIDRCVNGNEITLYANRLKKNNLKEITGKTVLTVAAGTFVVPREIK